MLSRSPCFVEAALFLSDEELNARLLRVLLSGTIQAIIFATGTHL